MPSGAFNICCPRVDSALKALSTLRGLRGAPEVPPLCRETQSLGQQMLNAPVGINGLTDLICSNNYERNYYARYEENSNIYCALINISKAFDGTNIDVMIDQLLKSSLPKVIVRTVRYMLKNTFADVGYNNRKEGKWKMNKGSRQEGIL